MSVKNKPNGYILHEDKYRVIIATGFETPSDNEKTGDMLQVWILVKSENPLKAIDHGNDSLICGDCPAKDWCYVNVGQAPLNIWRTWLSGGYPMLTDYRMFYGRKVRFGAYGDPAFIPLSLVELIASLSDGWTGYTHQWRNPLFAGYKQFLMASVESIDGKNLAVSLGWRTFRASAQLDLQSDEIECLADSRGISCADCGLCRGQSRAKAKSIVIKVHGSKKNHFKN